MPSIQQLKTTWDVNVRQQTDAKSVTRGVIAGNYDLIADELKSRGVKVVNDTTALQAESGADGTIILVKDTGFFQKSNVASGINFPASGGGYWIQVAKVSPVDLSNYYTKAETDSALSNKISNAQKGAANGVVGLTASSKIDPVYLPSIAINKIFVVANAAERLALTDVDPGDAVKETEPEGQPTYILAATPASAESNWVQISTITIVWDAIVGKPTEFNAGSIKGKALSAIVPTNGQILKYNVDTETWEPASISGVSGNYEFKKGYTITAGTTPGFAGNTDTVTQDDWIGWDIIPTRMGYGPLDDSSDYTYDIATGKLTLTQPGDKFGPNEKVFITFQPRLIE